MKPRRTTSQSEGCPVCGKPKQLSVTGSFSQWISTCQCKDEIDANASQIVVCARCGQQIDEIVTGSFTQWVLKPKSCECRFPVQLPVSNTRKVAPETKRVDESTIEIDSVKQDNFPLERYKPIRRLGFGGAGIVYLCTDTRMDKEVAVKVLKNATSTQIVDCQQEARLTARLSHRNLISILDLGLSEDGSQYMVFEYLDGVSLEKILATAGPMDEATATDLFLQMSDALSHAHDHQVFHRDIKASNTLVTQNDDGSLNAFIIDFGIAFMNIDQSATVQGRTLVGSPTYMSPDQLEGRKFDARSEIYSLGVLMYQTLTGELPFTAGDALAVLQLHSSSPVPPFRERNPELVFTTNIESVVMKCLEKNPDERYQSMRELNRALSAVHTEKQKSTIFDKVPIVSKQTTWLPIASIAVCTLLFISFPAAFIWYTSDKQPARDVKPVDLKQDEIPTDLIMGGHVSELPEEIARRKKTKDDLKYVKANDSANAIFIYTGDKVKNVSENQLWTVTMNHDATDEDLKSLRDLQQITTLSLSFTPVTDSGIISNLKSLESVRCLKIRSTPGITAKGIIALSKLPNLKMMFVTAGGQEDEYFKAFRKLKLTALNVRDSRTPESNTAGPEKLRLLIDACQQLKFLELSGVGVNDRYMNHLTRSRKLETIALSYTSVSNPGFMQLEKLKSLKLVLVRGCIDLSKYSLQRLHQKRPDITVRER